MDLNIIWFILLGILLVGYAILDGFDLGVGVLYLLTKDEKERQIYINSIGPVWDGNEVWLLTFGGALFAAFPIVYATVFSSLYLALMLLLFALIFRAVSMEFQSHSETAGWKRFWGWSFGIGSLLPAILFGAAIGNILQGLPIASDGSVYVSFLSLLNPYALLIGIFSLAMFVMHGAAYLAVKTEGEIQKRAVIRNNRAWMVFVLLYLISVIMSYFNASFLFEGMLSNPLFWIVFLLFLISIIYIPVATNSKKYLSAFFTSCLSISLLIALMGISLFPRLVPSSIDLANSLTIYNASSSGKTLTAMLIIVLIGMPVVIGYTIWIYRIFGGKTSISDNNY